MPSSARGTKYGGIEYRYNINGNDIVDTVPGTTFHPASAPDDELSAFHWPLRPSNASSDEYKKWLANAQTYKGALSPSWCTVHLPGSTSASHASKLTRSTETVSPLVHAGSTFTAGYENYNGSFEKVVGHFTQPTVNGGQWMLTWLGLHGTEFKERLFQAGTHNIGLNTATAFWEVFCSSGESDCIGIQDRQPVYPGDDVAVSVSFNPYTGGNDVAWFQVTSNGVLVVNATDNSVSPIAGDASLSSYFVEKMTVPQRTLSTFASFWFTNVRTYATWHSSTFTWFGNEPYRSYMLTKDGGFYAGCGDSRVLAYPDSPTASTFRLVRCSNQG